MSTEEESLENSFSTHSIYNRDPSMAHSTVANGSFADIEMLEIPDDLSSVSSKTEGVTDDESSISGDFELFHSFNPEHDLNEWLDSEDAQLEYQFQESVYTKSLGDLDKFSEAYIEYVNLQYRILNDVSKIAIAPIQGAEELDDPMGVVISSHKVKPDLRAGDNTLIDDAFSRFTDNIKDFISANEEVDVDRFCCIASILDCLKANYFCTDVAFKPNLIAAWVNWYDEQPDQEIADEVVINTPKPYLHPLFWKKYLAKLLIRGLTSQAVEALNQSMVEETQETDPVFYQVVADFKVLLDNYSTLALKGEFTKWKYLCSEFRDMIPKLKGEVQEKTNADLLDQILDLLRVITGFTITIEKYCENWYEYFLCLSLYKIRDDEQIYKEYYEEAILKISPSILDPVDYSSVSEHCFSDILGGNFIKVLNTINRLDPTTTAYVARFLEAKGLLQPYYSPLRSLITEKTISEYFLTCHAYDCLNVHTLVPVGFGLLLNHNIFRTDETRSRNELTIANVLANLEFKTNDDLEWGLTVCAKLHLKSTAKQIYLKYGKKSLQDGFVFESLNMFVKCYDPYDMKNAEGILEIHSIVWDLIFQDSLLNNRPVNDELINNVIEHEAEFEIHPVINQCISPYGVLYEFYKSFGDNSDYSVKHKLSRLIHLLKFQFMPKKFYPLLLAQTLPFFVNKDYQFELPDLVIMIELIDNFDISATEAEKNDGEELYVYSIDNIEEETQPYDWREILQKQDIQIPRTLKGFVTLLRNYITLHVGESFISNRFA